MTPLIDQLRKDITLRYVFALSLIAILSTSAFYTIHVALKSSDDTGFIVNISGKQRMLSQHIALDVHRIHHSYSKQTSTSYYNKEIAREMLLSHTKEMLHANKMLSTGILSNTKQYTLSPTIHDMYFGEMNLAQRVREYIKTARELSNKIDIEKTGELLKQIDSTSESLLKDLNKVVHQYQLEGEEKLKQTHTLEIIVWIATIITLLMEVIFIFQPMVRKIVALESKRKLMLQHLEDTVKIRTMDLEQANQQLSQMAFHDPLTGLRNRLNLEQEIEQAIKKHNDNHADYAVLMFDIDWFKKVNDEHGHDVGDTVLKEVANILVHSVRDGDHIYRAGGEEFVILLNRINYEDALKIAQKIRQTVQNYVFKIDTHEFSKTISGGLYHSSLVQTYDVTSVLKLIDTALYESKTNGRNRITAASKDSHTPYIEQKNPSITITFSDQTLEHVLDIVLEDEATFTCCNTEDLVSNKSSFMQNVHPDDCSILQALPKNISITSPFTSTIRIMQNDGHILIYRVKIYNENDTLIMHLQDSINIANKVSDSTLIQNLQAMLENTDDYIYFKDRNHVFTAASNTLVSVTSVTSRDQLVGKTDYDVFDKEIADIYFTLERQVFDAQISVAQEIQPTLDKDGNEALVDNRKYPIHDENGKIIGLFGIARVLNS